MLIIWASQQWGAPSPPADDAILLETGDAILLEDGGDILLE